MEKNESKLDISQILDLLSEHFKVERNFLRCISEINEKRYGSFYIVQEFGEGQKRQFGIFTKDNDLTTIFQYADHFNNRLIRARPSVCFEKKASTGSGTPSIKNFVNKGRELERVFHELADIWKKLEHEPEIESPFITMMADESYQPLNVMPGIVRKYFDDVDADEWNRIK